MSVSQQDVSQAQTDLEDSGSCSTHTGNLLFNAKYAALKASQLNHRCLRQSASSMSLFLDQPIKNSISHFTFKVERKVFLRQS